jgi:hypothetical protein
MLSEKAPQGKFTWKLLLVIPDNVLMNCLLHGRKSSVEHRNFM